MQTQEIIIHGTTSNGKVFRPSDWAERLCGILSSFNKDNRLSYHKWVQPVLIDKVRCAVVDAKLEEINPTMFRFLMDFAADNDLRIMTPQELNYHAQTPTDKINAESTSPQLPTSTNTKPISPNPVDIPNQATPNTPKTTPSYSGKMREIEAHETATAFAALSILRPMLNDINRFVEQVNATQRAQGYRLLGVFEEGKSNAVAVCGFREETDLVNGRHIHIDDLITIPNSRGRGYASILLAAVQEIAQQNDILNIEVDSSVINESAIAHRLYFQQGFAIHSYHFVKKLK